MDTKFRNFSKEEIQTSASNFEIIHESCYPILYFLVSSFIVSSKIRWTVQITLNQRVKLWLLARKHSPPFLSLSSAVSRKWSNGSTRKIRDHSPHHLSPLCTTFHLLLTAVHLLIRHRRSTQFPPPLESSTE